MQQVLAGMPERNSVFAERVSQGFYLNVDVNRPEAARYGFSVADVQRVVSSEIGGADIVENVEGRQSFRFLSATNAISDRPPRSFRRRWFRRRQGGRFR